MSTATTTNGNKPAPVPVPQNQVSTLRNLLNQQKEQLAMALPKHLTPERMIRVAMTAVQRVPKLMECSPLSIVGGIMQAAELGLELSGPLGQAYLVPYYNKNTKQQEAQFQVGYRGLQALAMRSGQVACFPARVVYENDLFDYQYGTSPFIRHVPTKGDPGEIIAVYAVLNFKDGGCDFEVMSRIQIDQHRVRYSKTKYDSPWDTAWEEMAKKTVIRRLAKRAPLSVELQTAAVLDEYAEANAVQSIDNQAPAPQPHTGRLNLRGAALTHTPAAEPITEVSQQPVRPSRGGSDWAGDQAEPEPPLDYSQEPEIAPEPERMPGEDD